MQRDSMAPLPFLLPDPVPVRDRVMLRLAELLVDADRLLETLEAEDARTRAWVEPRIRNVCATVDSVMNGLTH